MKIGDTVRYKRLNKPTGKIVDTHEGTAIDGVIFVQPTYKVEWQNGDVGESVPESDLSTMHKEITVSKPTKFNEVKIGETFTVRGKTAVKTGSRSYHYLGSPEEHRTSGTTNVNGPTGDQKQRQKQKGERDRLNEIAKSAGYPNWSRLQAAALAGERITIN